MTAEEVWREARKAYNNCPFADFDAPDQAAVSVIRTAMEAYAAEKVAEALDWQPIETAPRDGSYILAIVAGNHPITGLPYSPDVVHFVDGLWLVSDEYQDEYDDKNWRPTHWMPLPAPPANHHHGGNDADT